MDGRKANRFGKNAVKNSIRRRKLKQYRNLCKLMAAIIQHDDFWIRPDRGNYASKLLNDAGVHIGSRMCMKYLRMLKIVHGQTEINEKNFSALHKLKPIKTTDK